MELAIRQALESVDFNSIVGVAQPFEWDQVMDKDAAIDIAIHCCCNGPVGVGKVTSFPNQTGEDVNIRRFVYPGLTNSSWKTFCKEVALVIKRNHINKVVNCNQLRLKRELWPLNESMPLVGMQ
jgi:hypothetical protein